LYKLGGSYYTDCADNPKIKYCDFPRAVNNNKSNPPAARIAVVGTGWWATEIHIPSIRQRKDAQLISLCDTDSDRLIAASIKYGVSRIYTNLPAMLAQEELDGVVVATSNSSHYTVTRACLNAGLHVMLEKPMTLLAQEAESLTELAAAKSRALIVGYPFNFTPYATRSREVILSGAIGAVQYINLVYNSNMTPLFSGTFVSNFAVHGPDQYTKSNLLGGGHGQVQLTHAIGLLCFVTGVRARRVNALMRNFSPHVDWIDALTVEFTNGAIGTVSGSGNWEGFSFRLEVGCQRGWVMLDAGCGTATIHVNGNAENEVVLDIDRGAVSLGHVTAHNLVDTVLGISPNGSPPEQGCYAVEILEAAYRSAAENGRTVTILELY